MGQGLSWVCKTCKIDYYLGYGGAKFHEEVLEKRIPSEDHEGHNSIKYYCDYTTVCKDGHMWFDGCGFVDDHLFLENYDSDYKLISFNVGPEEEKLNDPKQSIEHEELSLLGMLTYDRVLQGDPSLPDSLKKHKLFNTWKEYVRPK